VPDPRSGEDAGILVRILGPLEIRAGGRFIEIPGRGQRILLALLALNAGRMVSVDSLIDAVWDSRPPTRPRTALHAYIYRLRRFLRSCGVAARVEARYEGYTLIIPPGATDCDEWNRLVAAGRTAAWEGRWREEVTYLRTALALWRGSALTGVDTEAVQIEARRLEAARDQVLERCLTTELALGRYAEVVPELEALVASHPYHEGWCAKLMIALYGCGRQAEALAVYARARDQLVEQLGVEPGNELRRLQWEILAAHPPESLCRRLYAHPAARPHGRESRRPEQAFVSDDPAVPRESRRGTPLRGVRVRARSHESDRRQQPPITRQVDRQ